jgi:D-tyrosyl-tRNA(Tyr) deacylase
VRLVIQRVTGASVTVEGREIAKIGPGLAVLIGVGRDDTDSDAEKLAEKCANLRIFGDEDGKMNLSVLDTGGEALVVSQFTLYGDTRRGRRPGFDSAAPHDEGNRLYQKFVEQLRALGVPTQTGQFQAHMHFEIANDGPVTILMDSEEFKLPRRG